MFSGKGACKSAYKMVRARGQGLAFCLLSLVFFFQQVFIQCNTQKDVCKEDFPQATTYYSQGLFLYKLPKGILQRKEQPALQIYLMSESLATWSRESPAQALSTNCL